MTANVPVRRYKIDADYSELIEEGAEWYRATDYDALLAERDSLRADAERWRYLRSLIGRDDIPDLPEPDSPSHADAILDSAMKERQT